MKNVIKWVLCLFVCLTIVGFSIQPALAEHGWEEGPPQNGKPEDPPNPAVGPTYGLPMTLDEHPWTGNPPQKGKPEDPVIPTMGSLAWWMQILLDGKPWIDDPPRANSPKE